MDQPGFTKVNFIANGNKLSSTIQFSDKNNQPLANSQVSYIILMGPKKSTGGKAITNAKGEIIVDIPKPESQQLKQVIELEITLSDGRKATKSVVVVNQKKPTDVQFFPESGNLIEELPCKIAVKAINSDGLGENIRGTIIDNDDTEILSFETTYLGMGSFSLTPMEGKSYRAKVKFADGTERKIDLPKAEKSGYVININNIDTAKMTGRILLSRDLINKGELTLLGQHHGEIIFNTKVPTAKQIATLSFSKTDFPSGILQLTLFSAEAIPVAERVVFINQTYDKIDVSLPDLKPDYGKRSAVNLTLQTSNGSKPVIGSFSVAVTNASVITPDFDNESNILTSLLLTSDVVGYVEKPNHYFLKNDVETRDQLDNLMLTQGWRKINWSTMNNNQLPSNIYKAENGMTISGDVTKNKNPVVDGKITLLSSSKSRFIATAETDNNGHFSFDDTYFGDSLRFVLQASTKDDKKDVSIKLDKVASQEVTTNKNSPDIEVNVNASLTKYLKESNDYFEEQYKKGFLTRTNQLQTVNVIQKRINRTDSAAENSRNLNGRGRANYIVTANDLRNTTSLSQYFAQGRVMGVADSAGYPILTRFRPKSELDPLPPIMAISLDGMVLENFRLDDISVEEVQSVEVLTTEANIAMYGLAGHNGVLVITTKIGRGKKASEIYAPGLVTFTPKGYDVPRQFYSPKYDSKTEIKPDLRTTVYWNPYVATDKDGKSNLNFFNTDQSGNYRIVIEGIDGFGNLARKIFNYQVK